MKESLVLTVCDPIEVSSSADGTTFSLRAEVVDIASFPRRRTGKFVEVVCGAPSAPALRRALQRYEDHFGIDDTNSEPRAKVQ